MRVYDSTNDKYTLLFYLRTGCAITLTQLWWSHGQDAGMCMQASVHALSEEVQACKGQQQGAPQAAWPRMNQAVSHLAAQHRQGQLPGVFYGRLHSLATVPAPADALAVNAVLSELCNLVSVLAHPQGEAIGLRHVAAMA